MSDAVAAGSPDDIPGDSAAPGGVLLETSVLLETRAMSVGYGSIAVVHDLNIAVHAGEIVALLGANGAGKTTTLLALAGELPLTSGEVEWLGHPVGRLPLHKRVRQGMAFVPEERSVIPGLSVSGNLRLGPGGVAPAVALFPELEPLLKRKAGLLSGGEQQILSLARALAARPRLLLADELSLGLAPLIVVRLLEALRSIAMEQGIGVLLVEQQVQSALTYSDRAYVLRRGQVVLEGPSARLRDNIADVEAMYLTESAGPDDKGKAGKA